MGSKALKTFLEGQVGDLDLEDPDVTRVLVLIANVVEAKDDPAHQALQNVFSIFGKWK